MYMFCCFFGEGAQKGRQERRKEKRKEEALLEKDWCPRG
jgi:hypothetical protein